jgi:hypothetical protein
MEAGLRASDKELLKFWEECLERRKKHYVMHMASMDVLNLDPKVGHMGADLTQARFTTDAYMKFRHAHFMVEFFEARIEKTKEG